MYVVIGGGGLVGQGLARELSRNRHDVVVVEQDQKTCESLAARTGVMTIHGNATDIGVLEEADIRKADVAVAAMPRDADNLAFSLLARNAGVERTIARVRDPRYETAYRLAGVKRTIGISELFVRQIVLDVEQPTLQQVATFGGGKATIVVVNIPQNAEVDGQAVEEIAADNDFPQECVIAGIYRESEERFIFPRGPIRVRAGDQVFLAADTDNVREAAKRLQQ